VVFGRFLVYRTEKVAEGVETYVDMVAERIVQLGGIAEGTVRAAAARSRLDEYPLSIGDGAAHVEAVAKALSTFGREARVTIDEADTLEDADTADLFTEISHRPANKDTAIWKLTEEL
jgi:starvation-inducible DNA-binding protein